MNTMVNPMFAKFDAVLGKTTPTVSGGASNAPVSSRSQEVLDIAKKAAEDNKPKQQIGSAGQALGPEPEGTAPHGIAAIPNTLFEGGKKVMSDLGNLNKNATEGGDMGTGANLARGAAAGGAAAGHVAGDIASTAGGILGDFMSPFIPQGAKEKMGDAAKFIQDKVNSIPGMTPEIAQSLGDVFNTISLAVGSKAEPVVAKGVQQGAEGITNAVEKGVQTVKGAVGKTPEEIAAQNLSSATEDVRPDYSNMTPAQRAKLNAQTITKETGESTPRVNEGGVIKGRSVNLTPVEESAAQELSKIPGYKSSMSHLEKYHVVQDEIASEAENLTKSLKNEGQVIPKREIVGVIEKAVKNVPEESLLLQESDPVISNYMRVARNAAEQNNGTLEGVLKVRKAMDAAYQNARGKMAFGSDKISALDDVHQAARDALNDYAIERAQNVDVKASLQKQSNLYRAADSLLPKSAKEAGSTIESIQNLIKKHPGASALILGETGRKVFTGSF